MPPVFILATATRSDAVEQLLKRSGRFGKEIMLDVPNEKQRCEVLEKLTVPPFALADHLPLRPIAMKTPGYVPADLQALCIEAGRNALKRYAKTLSEGDGPFYQAFASATHDVKVETIDFERALTSIQASVRSSGFAKPPDVSWADIGALAHARSELHLSIIDPLTYPDLFQSVGLTSPAGCLLWGPPGCGKTLLAKAVANEMRCSFISVKGSELLSKYVGESEREVRRVFDRARSAKPCVIFFDEMDALAPTRGGDKDGGGGGGGQVVDRVVNALLTEMDGLEGREGVYIIGATNRPDMIDPALRRPGRLDKLLFISLPDASERLDILRKVTRMKPIADDLDLLALANDPRCERFSGADLAYLVREASALAVQEHIQNMHHQTPSIEMSSLTTTRLMVTASHFEEALGKVRPSVTDRDLREYEKMQRLFSGAQEEGPHANLKKRRLLQ